MNLRGMSIALLLCLCADAAWRSALPPDLHPSPVFALDAPPSTHASRVACEAPEVMQQGRIPMPENTPAAHASSLVALDARHPLGAQKQWVAFWFAGTRESAPDVGIAAATYDRAQQRWDAAQWVVTREDLSAQLGVAVRRIGNPMAWRDADGRLHLYVVATGLGGWAASRVVHLVESASQTRLHWVAERILPLMPLATWFNTSTLVRTQAQPLQDGGAWLPMYFELGTKYALAVRVGPQGQLLDLRRMTHRRDVLQPTMVATSAHNAVALMRDNGAHARVAWSQTDDGGLHWQDQPDAAAGNPDSSLAALRLPSGELWVAHNPLQERRSVLLLSRVRDPQQTWQSTVLAQDNAVGAELSYPSMAYDAASQQVWLTYTDQRRAIAFAQLRVNCREVTP